MTLIGVLDLETTGKLDPAHRIIEFSFRMYELETGEEKREVLMRFNPERNIDAKAFDVHGISIDDLKGKPVIAKCLPDIAKLMRQCKFIVAHNGGGPNYPDGFDYKFLKMEFERNNIEMPDVEWFDTMVEGRFATDLGKNPSLKELTFALDVDYDEKLAHKGDYDTAVLGEAFLKGVRHGWFLV